VSGEIEREAETTSEWDRTSLSVKFKKLTTKCGWKHGSKHTDTHQYQDSGHMWLGICSFKNHSLNLTT